MAEWAKLHTDILADPKLMRAARKGAKWLLYLPWLIAFAKRADDGGRLTVNSEPAEPEDYLQSIPCSTEKSLASALEELEKLGILSRELDGALSFSAWSRRQQAPSETPDAIRERVKRHRAGRKSKQINIGETGGNGDETTGRNGTEEEIEEEEECARGVTADAPGNAQEPDDTSFRAAPFIDAFREIRQGIPPAGIIAKSCKAVVGEVGMAEAVHRWNRFLSERRHSPPAYFTQEHGQYAGLALVNGRGSGGFDVGDEPEIDWIDPGPRPATLPKGVR